MTDWRKATEEDIDTLDTLFGLPIECGTITIDLPDVIVLSDWDEWIQYRWQDEGGEWHTQWGTR